MTQCPNCSSYKIADVDWISFRNKVIILVVSLLLSFLIFPLFFAAMAILSIIAGALKPPSGLKKCKVCGYGWDETKIKRAV